MKPVCKLVNLFYHSVRLLASAPDFILYTTSHKNDDQVHAGNALNESNNSNFKVKKWLLIIQAMIRRKFLIILNARLYHETYLTLESQF